MWWYTCIDQSYIAGMYIYIYTHSTIYIYIHTTGILQLEVDPGNHQSLRLQGDDYWTLANGPTKTKHIFFGCFFGSSC